MLEFGQPIQTTHGQSTTQPQCHWFLEGCCSHDSNVTRTVVSSESFYVGRGADCEMTLISHDVSKNHAQIISAGEIVIIKDLGSTNGTYVNGHRISDPTPVGKGDLIQFATLEFRLGIVESVPEKQTCEVDSMESGWMLSQMHQVLNLRQFWMEYQPIIRATDFGFHGVEALIRCDISGLKSPVQLFQTAARLGLEKKLSLSARDKAAQDISAHPCMLRLFLNTHPNEILDTELIRSLDEINQILGNWKLVIEVHEAAVPEMKTISRFREELHNQGIEIAYDDFGAGQSRLRELAEVPPDYVKFDRAMVSGLAQGSSPQIAIVQSLVDFCRKHEIQTLAEGIEFEEDSRICQELGFDYFQGYLYGRPMKREIIFDIT